MNVALKDAEKLTFQIFFSDTLAEIMFLLSGYVTLQTSFKNLTSNNRNFIGCLKIGFQLIVDKWIKIFPLVAGLIALEFVWPLIGDGPLYKEGSEFISTNCQNHYWNNFLLIANWFPSIEKCVPQLFYSCVDFQLSILLVITVTLFKYKKQLAISLGLIVASMIITGYTAAIHDVTPNFVSRNANLDDRMKFMDKIHLPTFSHLPAYFMGAMIALKGLTKTEISLEPYTVRRLKMACYILSIMAVFAPALHNTFQILPRSLVPIYIVLQKFFYIFCLFPSMLLNKKPKDEIGFNNNQVTSTQQETAVKYSFLTCLYKLTFSIYLINYYCIRFDFLTSRILFEPGLYHAVSLASAMFELCHVNSDFVGEAIRIFHSHHILRGIWVPFADCRTV